MDVIHDTHVQDEMKCDVFYLPTPDNGSSTGEQEASYDIRLPYSSDISLISNGEPMWGGLAMPVPHQVAPL